MSKQQYTVMKFDPATGEEKPYPSHAQQWRDWHGQAAWLFNPWSGQRRFAGDVGTDPFGHAILPEGEPIFAAPVRIPSGPVVMQHFSIDAVGTDGCKATIQQMGAAAARGLSAAIKRNP